MLEAACLAKLATWACTAAAVALKAHDLDILATLADLGGRTIEAGDALRDRPRDVLRKATDRLAAHFARDHAEWLAGEFGGDTAGRQDVQAALAALPDVIGKFLPTGLDFAHADLNAARIADEAVKVAGADEQFRAGTFGGRVLHALVAGAFTAAVADGAFARDMRLAIDRVLLERSSAAAASGARQEAALQRVENALQAGGAELHLLPRHRLKAPPHNLRELLMTELRATSFVGRGEELTPLKLWLGLRRGPRDIGVHCVTGQAGAGKTRLAIELCEWAEAQGWVAGFVRQEELKRFHESYHPSDWRWDKPTLVVVDYAAPCLPLLRPCLDELAAGMAGPQEQPLRLLLLERHAARDAGWWAELTQPSTLSGRGRDALIDDGAPLLLGPLRDLEQRRTLLGEAMRLAAPLLPKPPPVPPPPVPSADADPLFDRRLGSGDIETEPLFLVMAGILAAETGAPSALAMRRLDLAERLARRERERLQALARGIGADPELVPYLSACVTLQGGCNNEAATALVEEERAAFGDRSATRTDALVALLRDALAPAAGDAVDAVRPDLIGEAFVLAELARERRSAAQQDAVVARAFARAGLPVVQTVIRTAQDYAAGAAAHRSVGWLDCLARQTNNPFALMVIADALPQHTLALRERALEIHDRIRNALAQHAAEHPDLLPLLGNAHINTALRLNALGKQEAALTVARKGLEIYLGLAAKQPDRFLPTVAICLSNLANLLRIHGEPQAALEAARESVAIRRALAAQRPEAFRHGLARSLTNLTSSLRDLGKPEEALATAREAVQLYRELAKERPDAFRPFQAQALNNLAISLGDIGEFKAALAAAREAVDLYRALAAQSPDAFRPYLATSLNTLASSLTDLGEREMALDAAVQAAELYRELAAQRPDAFRHELARPSMLLATCLEATGQQAPALAANVEAVAALTPAFVRTPQAFAPLMAAVMRDYLRRCAAFGAVPDEALLAPVAQAFAALRRSAGEDA